MVQTGEDSGKQKDKRLSTGKFSIVLIVYDMGVVLATMF